MKKTEAYELVLGMLTIIVIVLFTIDNNALAAFIIGMFVTFILALIVGFLELKYISFFNDMIRGVGQLMIVFIFCTIIAFMCFSSVFEEPTIGKISLFAGILYYPTITCYLKNNVIKRANVKQSGG